MDKQAQKIKEAWEALVKVLPEWAKKNRSLFLLADQELIIQQAPRHEVHIKRSRCIQCGECCLEVSEDHTPFGRDDEEKCKALYKEGDRWLCKAGPSKPFRCLADPMKANIPDCYIRYF